jgi:Eukaryotic translation initiation factor 2 alpha subunit
VVPAVTEEIKDTLVKNIRRRMTPQPVKIRADVEIRCYQFDGVLHIQVSTSSFFITSFSIYFVLVWFCPTNYIMCKASSSANL